MDETDNSTTLFVEGTRNLIVWNLDNETEYFKCFYDMTMNTTTTTYGNSNEKEVVQSVVERGDDVMIFSPTDMLSNGVENVVSSPGLYQMMNGMVGWSTNVTSGISNVTMIDGVFIDLCKELDDGGGAPVFAGGGGANIEGGVQVADNNLGVDPPPPGGSADPSVSISSTEPPSSGFVVMWIPWQGMMMVLVLVICASV